VSPRRILGIGASFVLIGVAAVGFFFFCVKARKAGAPSVILISIDTLRADRLNCYGYGKHQVSPNIDALANDGILFEHHVVSSPWTTPSHISMLTSLHPSSHGMMQSFKKVATELCQDTFNSLPEDRLTLADALHAAGYATAAFTGGITLHPDLGFRQGFERYDTSMYKLNSNNVASMFEWIESQAAGPFFLFLHTFEVHAPYLNSALLAGQSPEWLADHDALCRKMTTGKSLQAHVGNTKAQYEFLAAHDALRPAVCDALYTGGIITMDSWIGRLVEQLRARGLYDETMIVLTSDHGEELADHNPKNCYNVHGHSAFEEMVRVPLIVKLPHGKYAGAGISAVTGGVDIMPTILDILQIDPGGNEMQGQSLRPLWTGESDGDSRMAFCESAAFASEVKCVRTQRFKYIIEIPPELVRRHGRTHVPHTGIRRMLFDLAQDPREQHNMVASGTELPHMAAQLERALRGYVAVESGNTTQIRLDEETKKRLKSLGYVR